MSKSLLTISMLGVVLLFSGASCVSLGGGNGEKTSGPAGMFMSQDRGDTWQPIVSLPTSSGIKNIANVSVYRLVDDPSDPDTMYLTSPASGMFFTYDNGATWQRSADGSLSSGYVYGVAVHPKNKCVLYATNGRQVYRSDDCSRHWTELYRESRLDIVINSLAFNYFPPYQIYLSESNGDIMESFDSGNSWNVVKRFNTRIYTIVTSPLQEGLVYVTTASAGLYRSDNGGSDWLQLEKGLKKYSGAMDYRRFLLHAKNPDTIYWVSTYGILRSDDKGETWNAYGLLTPPGSASIYAFAVNPQNDNEIFYTATIGARSTLYKSMDGGKNWITKKLPSGQIPTVLRSHPKKSNVLFMGFFVPTQK